MKTNYPTVFSAFQKAVRFTIYHVAFTITCALPAFAQKSTLEGTLTDTLGTALQGATVILMQPDSVMSAFAASDAGGKFLLRRVSPGSYLLQVSYVGFGTHWQALTVAGGEPAMNLGSITLRPVDLSLSAVEVTAERAPLRMSGDTINYNAAAFRVQPGDVVEDLLKKLPGVEVQADGSIKAQGEQVRNVFVDGKEFFGNDPTIATKNLPADAVNKVQVYDKKSERAEFTGIEDGRDEKTINLELKPDRKHGYFGKASAGGGSTLQGALKDDKSGIHSGRFNINRFGGNTQMSLIGLANNNNEQGFSFNDYMNFMGGLSSMMSSGGGGGRGGISLSFNADDGPSIPLAGMGQTRGINTTKAAGLNLNHEFSKKTKLSSSYFFNQIGNEYERFNERVNLLDGAEYRSEEIEERQSRNRNHRLNMTLRHEVDSFQNFSLRSRLGINQARLNSLGENVSYDPNEVSGNYGDRDYRSSGDNLTLSSDLTWRRRFRTKGRALVGDFSFGLDERERGGTLLSTNNYLLTGGTETIHQRQGYSDEAMSYGGTLAYTEPLGKGKYIEFSAGRQNFTNDTRKDFYDIQSPGSEDFNEELSNRFLRGYTYDRGGLSLMLNRPKWNLTLGSNLQQSTLEGTLEEGTPPIRRKFLRLLPSLFYNYEIAIGHNTSAEYRTTLREPALEQLNPVVDNSNPLSTYTGNPDLQPEYLHDFNLHYVRFDQFSFTSLFATLGGSYIANRITNATSIDEFFRQNVRPVNTEREVSLRGYLNFQTPLRFMQCNINLGYTPTWSRGIIFVNEDENEVTRLTHGMEVSLENRKKDIVEAKIGMRLSPNSVRYSVSESLDQEYMNRRYFADLNLTPGKKWTFGSSFDYSVYPAVAFGSRQTVALLRANIGRYFLKNNKGQLRLSAYDLLDQNRGISRNSSLNYVEQERITAIGRYVMLTFSYSISGFGQEKGVIQIEMGSQERE